MDSVNRQVTYRPGTEDNGSPSLLIHEDHINLRGHVKSRVSSRHYYEVTTPNQRVQSAVVSGLRRDTVEKW